MKQEGDRIMKKFFLIFFLIFLAIVFANTDVVKIYLINIRYNEIKKKFAIENLPPDNEIDQKYGSDIYYESKQICSIPNEIEFDLATGPTGYHKVGNCPVWTKKYDDKTLNEFASYEIKKVKDDIYLSERIYTIFYYQNGIIAEIIDNSDSECRWILHYNEKGDLERAEEDCGTVVGKTRTWEYNKDLKEWKYTEGDWIS